MTLIRAVHDAAVCEDCRVYLRSGAQTRELALAKGLLLIDGAKCNDTGTTAAICCLTLYDVRAMERFPFEEVACEILSGAEVAFSITAEVVYPGIRLRTVFRHCVPSAPVGIDCARNRWTFKVDPDDDVWHLIIDRDWGDICGGA